MDTMGKLTGRFTALIFPSLRASTLLIAVLLVACASGKKTVEREPAQPKTPWGYFSGPIDTRWESDGRTMTLLNELRYTDPKGVVWIAPAGSKVDGVSIPRAFWSFIGGPFEGKYRNASVLHDVAYEEKSRPWQEVDRMFYNAMRCSGVGPVEAKTMYYALYRHGRHWKFSIKEAQAATPEDANPPRATAVNPEEVDAIQQWIRQNNPTLDQIESRAEAKGR